MGGHLGEERTYKKLQERFYLLPKFQGMVPKLSTLSRIGVGAAPAGQAMA